MLRFKFVEAYLLGAGNFLSALASHEICGTCLFSSAVPASCHRALCLALYGAYKREKSDRGSRTFRDSLCGPYLR